MRPNLNPRAAPGSDLEWMQLQARVLFVHDTRGRLVRTREPAGQTAPRFWLGRTSVGNCWRFGAGVPDATVRRLARAAALEAPLADGGARPPPPERLPVLRRALEADAPLERVWCGPAFKFPPAASEDARPEAPEAPPGTVVRPLDARDLARLPQELAWLVRELEASAPCVAVLVDGRVASVCWSARQHVLACEAGVETLPALRRRGLAARAVGAWAVAVRAEGREPLYSTSWDNRASLGVARRLGLRRYGEDLHFT